MTIYEYAARDLTIVRGIPFAAIFRILDADEQPISSDDHTIYAAVHATDEFDGTVTVSFLVEPLDVETGDYVFRLPQESTAGLVASRSAGWFYSWYSGPSTDGERRPLWRGRVSVR